MKKIIPFCCGLLVIGFSVLTHAAPPNTYDPTTNILYLPSVNSHGATYNDIYLQLRPEGEWTLLPTPPEGWYLPQIQSLDIEGPDIIMEGGSAVYSAQVTWITHKEDGAPLLKTRQLPISVTGSAASISVAGGGGGTSGGASLYTVTAKQVLADEKIILIALDNEWGVSANVAKEVTIKNISTTSIVSYFVNFIDINPMSVITLANGQKWRPAGAKDSLGNMVPANCVLNRTYETGTNPTVTISRTATGYIMEVSGSQVVCAVEPL